MEEMGRQRAKTQIDPALGMTGGATGAPLMEPLPPVEPPEGAVPGEEAVGLPPEAPDDIMAAIEQELP